ncbi:unnamed protein product [Spirodela intermedia]|uniref:Uncharacterized protein n=1 Tax=Spirodela intermedia TaxID=51605 RepID=A0A7I8L0U5_SPIIN|nr:unnamed protein product [Spirodela intermedia]
MFTPGAIRSGLRTSRVRKLGPRDENAATTGDGRMPSLVPEKVRVAEARWSAFAYRLMAAPSASPTATAGRRWLSATSSSPLAAVLARIIPTPPACFTTCPFCTRAVIPRSQRTIFPATRCGSRAPSRQRALGSAALLALPPR